MNTGTEVTGGGPVVVDVASVVVGPSVVVTASVVLDVVLAVVVSIDVVAGVVDVVGDDVTSSDAPDVEVVDVASLVLSIPAESLFPP